MNQVVIAARKRTDLGSGNANRIRRSGRVPAVMYGRGAGAVSLDLDALEFTKGIRGISESTIIKLDVDGTSHEAFVKDTQRDILTGKILHVDFYEVDKDKLLHARVPLHVVGTAAGTRSGGILEAPLHEIEVECFPRNLPEHIQVDVTALNVNESIHVRDLKLSSEVKILSNLDQVIAQVKYAKAEAVPEAEAAAPAAAAAAAPAAAATPAAKA